MRPSKEKIFFLASLFPVFNFILLISPKAVNTTNSSRRSSDEMRLVLIRRIKEGPSFYGWDEIYIYKVTYTAQSLNINSLTKNVIN